MTKSIAKVKITSKRAAQLILPGCDAKRRIARKIIELANTAMKLRPYGPITLTTWSSGRFEAIGKPIGFQAVRIIPRHHSKKVQELAIRTATRRCAVETRHASALPAAPK